MYSTHTAPSVDWIARDQGEVSHDRKSHMPNLFCKSEAEAINVGLFDGVGIRCKTHGEFEVADSALAMHKDTEATRWEAALKSAKDRAKATQETWPRITTCDFR